MMITALKRSRQFKVLDRVNFGDFMNEQNLKTNDRLAGNEGPGIGEMTGADYIIQGAITEYQVDRNTGGIGLNIGGVGGTKEYARATTAVDIRILDSTTGEVVWSESLKGEIEGERVGVQAFSFMGNNIVEFETGRGKQEVINLIVRTLLEEAVFKIYQQGVI
jgi:curli biogenesis system outer membrane secretion channel CsgG